MKSITVHGIDKEMERLISEQAKSAGTSVNQTVKDLLAEALGLSKDKPDHRGEFVDLFGIWTDDDEQEFLKAAKGMETVEPGDWR